MVENRGEPARGVKYPAELVHKAKKLHPIMFAFFPIFTVELTKRGVKPKNHTPLNAKSPYTKDFTSRK